ncbi:MAG: hypothetical protein WAO00_14985 [Chthoniobacterales bacterium]
MKGRKAPSKLSQERMLRLAGEFKPPGTKPSGQVSSLAEFATLFCEARDLRLKHDRRELRERKRIFAVFPNVGRVLHKYLSGDIPPEETARRIRKLCPDDKVARAALDFFSAPPPEPSSKEQLAKKKGDIERSGRILKSWSEGSRHIGILAGYAHAGDADAIEDLVGIGHHAVQSLMIAKLTHPEAVRAISRSKALWPLLVSSRSPWEKSAAQQLEGLELGRDMEPFYVRFERPRGADENYPARQWARAAVRTLEETRWRHLTYWQYSGEFQELVFAGKAGLAKIPRWAGESCGLKLLSKETAPAWAKVMRDMIREQLPDFHTRPEWKNQRSTAAHSVRNTVGEVQNAILDDITSALKRVAPGCRNSPAEPRQTKKEKL